MLHTQPPPSAATHRQLLERAEAFISGFEDDSGQAVTDLLQELRAAIAAPEPAPVLRFEDRPLASCPLKGHERESLTRLLKPLLRYAGRPGDWGHDSQLGILVKHLIGVQAVIANEAEGGAA